MRHARAYDDRIQDPAGLIAEDEPVFLVRAKDICSAGTMRAWCELARVAGADEKMIQLVSDFAEESALWQLENGSKVPGLPEKISGEHNLTSLNSEAGWSHGRRSIAKTTGGAASENRAS